MLIAAQLFLVLMADHGILVVAWAWPEDLARIMPHHWMRLHQHRFVPPVLLVKCPFRQPNSGENVSKRSRERETGVTYVSLENLTPDEAEFCMGFTRECELTTSSAFSQVSFLWLAGASIPERCRGQSGPLEYMLHEAQRTVDCSFLSAAQFALTALSEPLAPNTKKARRLVQAIAEVTAAVESYGRADVDVGTGRSSSLPRPVVAAVLDNFLAEESAQDSKCQDEMLPLRVVSDGEGIVDCGDNSFQQIVDAATSGGSPCAVS